MAKESDINETEMLLNYGEKVCENLLKDHTTQQNIYWATDSYAVSMGEGYSFFDHITLEKITGDKGMLIQPRAVKSKEEQIQRAKDKAEVFTPSWICNAQNNLIDEAWFGRSEGLFNTQDPDDSHKWITNEDKIIFPNEEGKTWKDYVADMRLEITCGEAPYLANRYDAVTGDFNSTAIYRIGMLDRKLRVVSENTKDSKEWILWAKIALRSTYGFEWQGDNLLLAREALFYTFAEHYKEQFGEKKYNQNKTRMMPGVAYIVSWNLWQMDGLTYGLPGYAEDLKNHIAKVEEYQAKLKQYEQKLKDIEESKKNSLFGDEDFTYQKLIKPEEPKSTKPHERFCLIKDFFDGVNLKKSNLISNDFHDLSAPKQTFESLVNKK